MMEKIQTNGSEFELRLDMIPRQKDVRTGFGYKTLAKIFNSPFSISVGKPFLDQNRYLSYTMKSPISKKWRNLNG